MSEQPMLIHPNVIWMVVRDGDPSAMSMFMRHYSATNKNRKIQQFVGPGEKMVLLTPCAKAIFAWRKELHRMDDQTGTNCTVFRNEGAGLSSDLIREADALAWERWPADRHFTFVDPNKTKHKRDPGRCFIKAGWKPCGYTKTHGLRILECYPDWSAR